MDIVATLRRPGSVAAALRRRHSESLALDEFPWPVPLRVAAFISALVSLAAVLIDFGSGHLQDSLIALGLGFLFLQGLYWITQAQCRLAREKRIGIFLIQTVVALALILLRFNIGSEILLFVLAAELQFVFSFPLALAGTVLLNLVVVAVVIFIPPGYVQGAQLPFLLTSPSGFAFVAAFTRSAVSELVQRHQSSLLLTELHGAHSQLKAYADQIEELATARERNRMAREIHDTLGHYLTVINVQIESAQKLTARDPVRSIEAMANAKHLATECLQEVRRSVAALRPTALEEVSLPEAVARLVDDLRRSSGMAMHVEIRGEGDLPPPAEVVAYRVVQEALTNVRKHANAQNIRMRFDWESTQLVLTIADDGCGAEQQMVEAGGTSTFGLQAMRERLDAIGGELQFHTRPGEGFTVCLRVPRSLTRDLSAAIG